MEGIARKEGEYSPLIVDTFGGFGPQAVKAIAKVANHCRVMGDDDANLKKKRLAQKIRFVTMKGIATQILRRSEVEPVTAEEMEERFEDEEAEAAAPAGEAGHGVSGVYTTDWKRSRAPSVDEGSDQYLSDSSSCVQTPRRQTPQKRHSESLQIF